MLHLLVQLISKSIFIVLNVFIYLFGEVRLGLQLMFILHQVVDSWGSACEDFGDAITK